MVLVVVVVVVPNTSNHQNQKNSTTPPDLGSIESRKAMKALQPLGEGNLSPFSVIRAAAHLNSKSSQISLLKGHHMKI